MTESDISNFRYRVHLEWSMIRMNLIEAINYIAKKISGLTVYEWIQVILMIWYFQAILSSLAKRSRRKWNEL